MADLHSALEALKLLLQAIQIATTIWIASRNRSR